MKNGLYEGRSIFLRKDKLYAVLIIICCVLCPAWAVSSDDRWSCESIVVAEYVECSDRSRVSEGDVISKANITRFTPPSALFRVVDVLKGPPLNRVITIKFDFVDDKPLPNDWKFDKSMMPKPGSKWILFIPNAVPHGVLREFETWNGSLGREVFSVQRGEEIRKVLAAPGIVQAMNWNDWNKNIDDCLQRRFGENNGIFSHGPRLSAKVVYTVTKQGQVMNVHFADKSASERFNLCVENIVKSMAGEPFLQFPEGAKEEAVEKSVVFSNHLWYENLQGLEDSLLPVPQHRRKTTITRRAL
ncbi:MAG TPA: hypothetical protein V6C97_24180 [Oculatellaceae cyanobacterium]